MNLWSIDSLIMLGRVKKCQFSVLCSLAYITVGTYLTTFNITVSFLRNELWVQTICVLFVNIANVAKER